MTESRAEQAERSAWQRRLLPLMAAFLVLAALFFSIMSIFELRDFYDKVAHRPFDLEAQFENLERGAPAEALNQQDYIRFKVLALLEAEALERRYHQANATMLARVWTRQLGFITGMLITLVGAAFILGRLQEETTTLELASDKLKGALATSSPGILLAVLGTGLMALTIWIPFGVETRDVNTYLKSPPRIEAPPPSPFMPEVIDGAQTPQASPMPDPVEERLFGTPPGGNSAGSQPTEGGAQ